MSKEAEYFDFMKLPKELADIIVECATSVAPYVYKEPRESPKREPIYVTALALARVSKYTQAIVRRHLKRLLKTVVLRSQRDSLRFAQEDFSNPSVILGGEFPVKPEAIWVSQYDRQYDKIRFFFSAETLGLNFAALELLYTLGTPEYHCNEKDVRTKKVVFAGNTLEDSSWCPPPIKWDWLVKATYSKLFLQNLTHLTIWTSSMSVWDGSHGFAPSWINEVPFQSMKSLTHFAFPLIWKKESSHWPVLSYILPGEAESKFKTWQDAGYTKERNATVFGDWALGLGEDKSKKHPAEFGRITWHPNEFECARVDPGVWEIAFARGEHNNWESPDQNVDVLRSEGPSTFKPCSKPPS